LPAVRSATATVKVIVPSAVILIILAAAKSGTIAINPAVQDATAVAAFNAAAPAPPAESPTEIVALPPEVNVVLISIIPPRIIEPLGRIY